MPGSRRDAALIPGQTTGKSDDNGRPDSSFGLLFYRRSLRQTGKEKQIGMQILRLESASAKELSALKAMIGEAFVTNELFREFGAPDARRELVRRYMAVYIDYVYESKALYVTEDHRGVIGLIHSKKAPVLPQLKILLRLFRIIPIPIMKRYLAHVRQISSSSGQYASKPHIDTLFVCVDPLCKGQGYARQLVSFAMTQAENHNVPLLIDTDMLPYAQMYQYFGCELYYQATADNGVPRYNLVWKPTQKHG